MDCFLLGMDLSWKMPELTNSSGCYLMFDAFFYLVQEIGVWSAKVFNFGEIQLDIGITGECWVRHWIEVKWNHALCRPAFWFWNLDS